MGYWHIFFNHCFFFRFCLITSLSRLLPLLLSPVLHNALPTNLILPWPHYHFISPFSHPYISLLSLLSPTLVSPHTPSPAGVVDKSVELLSSGKDSLTLEGVFEVAERAMVGSSENTQIDDSEYCRENHREYCWMKRVLQLMVLYGSG